MKSLVFIFSMFISCSLLAREYNDIIISQTFSIHIPYKISTKVEMPSLNSKLYRTTESSTRNAAQILVVHNRPSTFANKFSIERYWKKGREQTKSYDKKENDLGCTRSSARSYQCSRDVIQDEKFISETIFWNTKNDLVLIRIASINSFSESRTLLNKIKVVQNSRIPAGVVK